jgi:hypothetical protein
MRVRVLPAGVALACCAAAIVTMVTRLAVAEDRTSRRSAEMALPDPYLDPAWPDTAGDEMEKRYAPGKSDSVEEVPLEEEVEMENERRALQELTGETPAVTGAPGPQGEGVEPAPDDSRLAVPDDGEEEAPDVEQRDPVEW